MSKAYPSARHRGLGFKVGDVFPEDDPIARWATALAIAANDAIYLNVHMIEEDLPPEIGIYYLRLVAAHFFEAADWLKKTRSNWPEIDELIRSLDGEAQGRYDLIVAFVSQRHPMYRRLVRSRNTLFHYPKMHPDIGTEELAKALGRAKDIDGWIEGGEDYASFRAAFADEVALQFLSEDEEATRDLAEALRDPVFDLVKFAEAVLLSQIKRVSPDKITDWNSGPRPSIVLTANLPEFVTP